MALKDVAERVLHEVTRPSRVAVAKRLVEAKLSIFIDLAALPSVSTATGINPSGSRIGFGESLVANRKEVGQRIILVDGDQVGLALKSPENLGNLLGKLAEDCQIIYAFGKIDLLQESLPPPARRGVPGLRMAPV